MLRHRLVRGVAAAAAVVAVSFSTGASDVSAYPPSTPPTTEGSTIDVSAFSPVCVNDVPYIQYSIVPVGFSSSGPATLTISDINGNVVSTLTVQSLSGQILYPGAAVDADGNGIDWPGWALVDGVYVPDSSDEVLREGLSIEVEVNPTATATVTYPPATSACAGPEGGGGGGSGGSDDSSSSGVLPSTGSNATMITLLLGAGLLGAGVVTSMAMRRRHT